MYGQCSQYIHTCLDERWIEKNMSMHKTKNATTIKSVIFGTPPVVSLQSLTHLRVHRFPYFCGKHS